MNEICYLSLFLKLSLTCPSNVNFTLYGLVSSYTLQASFYETQSLMASGLESLLFLPWIYTRRDKSPWKPGEYHTATLTPGPQPDICQNYSISRKGHVRPPSTNPSKF